MENALTDTETASLPAVVQEFRSLIIQGYECLVKACKVYVQAITKDPSMRETFFEMNPEIPAAAWRRYEMVGRGALHPKLLTASTQAGRLLANCAYSEQEAYIEKPVEVLLPGGDTLRVELRNLTPEQTKQVFARDHVRSLGEQRAYIEDQMAGAVLMAAAKPADVEKPYKVCRGMLWVKDVKFTRGDLIRILADMES